MLERPNFLLTDAPGEETQGNWRFHVDYPGLNSVTIRDMLPIPKPGERRVPRCLTGDARMSWPTPSLYMTCRGPTCVPSWGQPSTSSTGQVHQPSLGGIPGAAGVQRAGLTLGPRQRHRHI